MNIVSFRGRSVAMLALFCIASGTLGGCARLGAMSRVDPASVAVYPGNFRAGDRLTRRETDRALRTNSNSCPVTRGRNDFRFAAIDLECFRFPEGWQPQHVSQENGANSQRSAYAQAAEDATARNRLTSILLSQSDEICTIELGRITSNEATVNSSLSILNTGLTAAANIVSGELAKSILTGGATVAGSSRDHINAHVYRSQFSYALARAITIERRSLRQQIEARYGDTPTEFTIDQAIRAVNEYHNNCSFYRGLGLVIASVEGKENLERFENTARIQAYLQSIDELRRIPKDAEGRLPPAIQARIEQLTLQLSQLRTGAAQNSPDDPVRGEEP
jgi:hypothetical protein